MKPVYLAAAALLATAPLSAQVAPRDTQPEQLHVVRRGDTLWDLARTYLRDPFLWPEIYRLNAALIRDPALIFPSERLRIPGPAELGAAAPRGEDELVFGRAEDGVAEAQGMTVRAAGTADVPIVAPGDFYRAGFVAAPEEVRPLGTLQERVAASAVPARRTPQIALYDRVYVTLASTEGMSAGDRLHFFRRGRAVKPWGHVYHSTGIGTVSALDGAVATVQVTGMYDVVALGDFVVPEERFPVPAGVAPQAQRGVEGTVIAFRNPHILQATQEIAYLDVGRGAGVTEGDEFEVYMPRTERSWGSRPELPIARLQVIRADGRTASARVVSLSQPALRAGLPVRLVAKMP